MLAQEAIFQGQGQGRFWLGSPLGELTTFPGDLEWMAKEIPLSMPFPTRIPQMF